MGHYLALAKQATAAQRDAPSFQPLEGGDGRDHGLTRQTLGEYEINEFNEIGRGAVSEPVDTAHVGFPQAWSDGVERLPGMAPPADWPAGRWPLLVNDARGFLAEWGAEAHGLDWSALDLFGVHERRPHARLDLCGLVPILCGHRVVELRPDSAAIEVQPAVQQTFRRWPRLASPNERTLIWELDNARHED